ncbi:hydrophilic protein [Panaeolus papilionaceus]|nr:hydrophilic protein [Panaeolus papilionaceus]
MAEASGSNSALNLSTGATVSSEAENTRLVELNRLKAKARQREKEQSASISSTVNVNNKRPLESSDSAASTTKPLKRDSRLGSYFEYDLSKMVNTKGGFLVDEGNRTEELMKMREKEREQQRKKHNLESDIPFYLDNSRNPKCRECNSVDIDQEFMQVFRCLVCKNCQNEKPEKYSLLTKTECKTDYLLTDPELKDEDVMPHLLKANPHKSTYANMMLFLRYQVEEFAWKKWGSPEALDAEYERRTDEKQKKKNKKFEQSLKELRKRTKEGIWQRRKDEEHRHEFGPVEDVGNGVGKQTCHSCGFSIEVEEL